MIEILKNIPFFSELNESDLQQIADNVHMDYFPAEYVVFNQGDAGEKMYVIKRGEVQVVRDNAMITSLKDNAFFGEMALVSNEPRNATIKTLTDVELLTIDKKDFKQLLETNRSIAEIVSYEVVKRSNAIY